MPRLVCLLACLVAFHGLQAESRLWTSSSGKQVTGTFLRVESGQAVLRLDDGREATVQLSALSDTDRAWVKANAGSSIILPLQPAPPPPTGDKWMPWDHRFMPATVQEPMLDMNIRVVKEAEGDCVYESGNFQFRTTAKLGAMVMRDICRAFESTHELVRRLPWGIIPRPEEGRTKFQAELFETRASYLATGAPTWSGGVYVLSEKVFRMPFEELGLTRAPANKSAGYTRSGTINNDTITHEITHQMMHDYLPYAPVWFLEGTAEYTAHLPYHAGLFNVAGAVAAFRDMRESRSKPQRRRLFRSLSVAPSWVGVPELWGFLNDITQRSGDVEGGEPEAKKKGGKAGRPSNGLDPKVLADRYYSSHALVFYFMNLDGAGDGMRLKKYFDALHEEKAKWTPFWPAVDAYNKKVDELRPAYTAYKKAMADFMQQPGVQDLGDGRFSYPETLKPPTPPPEAPTMPTAPDGTDPDKVTLKHLDVLLDGRSLRQLETDVRSAFAKAGIAL